MSELLALKRRRGKLLQQKLEYLAQTDLARFIPLVRPSYESPIHLEPLIDFFNDITFNKVERNLALTVPPRHGKTETTLMGIAFYLKHNPTKTVGYVSYAQTQSESKAVKVQALIRDLGLKLHPNLTNRKEFRLAEEGGILTTARGGSLTGQGVDLLVIDDPLSNRDEANSITIRNKVWDWYEDVAETRLEPHASQLIIHTRWHEDDLIGRLLQHRKNYEFVRLPALEDGLSFDGKESIITSREIGDPLWATRYPKKKLEDTKKNSEFRFASLYQGLPRAREDYLFKDFYTYKELPKERLTYTVNTDLAYTEKTSGDHSVIVVMAKKGKKHYVIDVFRYREKVNYSIELAKRLYNQYNVRIGIEANGPQKGIYDMFKSEIGGVYKIIPKGDKYSRALSFAEAWNRGDILLPESAPWLRAYITELQAFTGINDKEDDQVDASTHCYNRLSKTEIYIIN